MLTDEYSRAPSCCNKQTELCPCHRNYLIQLEETNVVGVVLETATAHVQTVLSDETMVVGTDAALS